MRNEVGNFQPALLGEIQSALTRTEISIVWLGAQSRARS